MTDLPPYERRVFCNRTLNMRSIEAIGFDMDYTLIHYRPEQWELSAYERLRGRLSERRWPVAGLRFDPSFAVLGLILDLDTGNVVKADRFGYVKLAGHGTARVEFEEQRKLYSRVLVDLAEPRWVFLNTFFSVSEACMYAQLVDLLDAGRLPGPMSYADLHRIVRDSLDEAHTEGDIKDEIAADPGRFVVLDADLPLALLDARRAGKKLLLITNSEWRYTREMMSYAFDRFLPEGTTWRQLFDLKIVQARKPGFFSGDNPIFKIVDERGRLEPVVGPLEAGGTYLGGNASLVERQLELNGEQILFVGDHIFADVHVSKSLLRWRTALVVRALEQEIEALREFAPSQAELSALMEEKGRLEHSLNTLRLHLQRRDGDYGPQPDAPARKLRGSTAALRARLAAIDERIAPLAKAHAELANSRWGLLLRAGNDKSNLAYQIERHADIYTSRVSNLLLATPFAYFRAGRTTLPHEAGHLDALENPSP